MSVISDMNWKSTAVVSGAGLLVTWLANLPPGSSPATGNRTPQAVAAPVAADIQRQAERLRVRVREEVAFANPARDPFRFAPRRAAPSRPPLQAPAALPSVPIATAPVVRLSGIAMDVVDGREERTAILKTPAGLVFAHEGEQVAGQFQVQSISEDAVVLIRLDDGSVMMLR